MRFVLKAAVALSAILLILVVAGYVALRSTDLEHYKKLIAASVQNLTGRELVINGDIRVRPSLVPAIVVEGIEFRNPGFATQPNMFTLSRLEGELELLPLLRGEIVINTIQLIEPILVLEKARGGLRNWRFGSKKRDGDAMFAPHIREATIGNGRISYLNSDTGNRVDFFIHEAQAHLQPGSDVIEATGRGGWKFREWQDVSIDAEGTLGSLASFFDGTPTEIDVTGRTDDVMWDITGSVGRVLRVSGVDLQLRGTTDSFANVASFTPFSLPDLGPVVGTARLTGDLPSYDVRDIDVRLQSYVGQARLTGSIESLVFDNRMDLDLGATAVSALDTLTAFGLDWPLEGALSTNLRLIGDKQSSYSLSELDIGLRDDGLRADLSGSVARIPGLQGVSLEAALWAEQLGVLAPVVDYELPPLGPVSVTGLLTRDTTGLRIEALEAQLTDDRVAASASGFVGNALRASDMALDVNIAVNRLSSLSDLAGRAIPDVGALRVDAALVRDDDAFRIDSLAGSVRGGSVDASVSGMVGDLRGFEGVDLRYSLRADSLGSLSELVGTELPETDALSSEGRVYYESMASHRLHLDSNLVGTGFDAKVAATVADVTRFRDARATIQLEADSLDEISRIMQRKLPSWGPLKMAGTIRHDATKSVPPEVEAMFTSGTTSARVAGVLDTRDGNGATDLEVDINTDTLASLSRFVDKPLPDAGPLRATTRLRATSAGYSFENLDISVGDSDLKGRMAWIRESPDGQTAKERTHLEGELIARRFDLRPWLANDSRESTPVPASRFVFGAEPFKLEAIRDYDADVSIRIGQLRLKQLQLRDVRVNYEALGGLLDLPITAVMNPGEINARLVVNATRTPAPIEFRLYANDVDTEQLSAVQREGMFQEGNININLELAGSGNSIREWVANVDGHLLLVINSGKISQPVLRLIGADILWQVANIVNPFTTKRDYLALECGVIGFRIRDGVARSDKWIATQSPEVTVLGVGVIDLGSESVQIALRPKAREGIGISASSLVNLVRVGGTLKNLKPEADPTRLLQSGATIGAAVATSGLTILAQGLYDRFTANQDVCETTHRNFIGSLTDQDPDNEAPGRGSFETITDK